MEYKNLMDNKVKIFNKRWYYKLTSKNSSNENNIKALLDDFSLDTISKSLVICFTPSEKILNKRSNRPLYIYTLFNSYIEYFKYIQNFEVSERSFYEVIFGELPQKPHFDIDLNTESVSKLYPNENIDTISDILIESLIKSCEDVLSEFNISLDLTKDLLIYTSHGENKRSFHVVINNKCHSNNKEAKEFYNIVTDKIKTYTNGKYIEFIDKSVYSSRQLFRMVGCQKQGTNRIKVFNETFWYQNKQYTHIYNEDVSDINIKKLNIIYESLISYTSSCIFIPIIQNKEIKEIKENLNSDLINYCIKLLHNKIRDCPFSVRKVYGNLILLKRLAPSKCPVCKKLEPHEHENPFIFIIDNKIYWNCRRSNKSLLLGFIKVTKKIILRESLKSIDWNPGLTNL